MKTIPIGFTLFICCVLPWVATNATGLDLQTVYPPGAQAQSPDKTAYHWSFSDSDLYYLTSFEFKVDGQLSITSGPACLGIGHCSAGAVWAVVIPESPGTATAAELDHPLEVEHIWLRFNPGELNQIFKPATVTEYTRTYPDKADIVQHLTSLIQRIAYLKITSSYQAQSKAVLPEHGNFTVDFRSTEDKRLFFIVNTNENMVRYINSFESRILAPAKTMTQEESLEQFHQLWSDFDTEYPGFAIRPEIDWAAIKKEYEPRFAAVRDAGSFAVTAAEMLRVLTDRHIHVKDTQIYYPVYTPEINSHMNFKSIGKSFVLDHTENGLSWSISRDHIGYFLINGWNRDGIVEDFDLTLENMRNTRGIIVDVRHNGGGSEPLAREVASRFVSESGVYSFSQRKAGDAHDALTEFIPRTVQPRGPWQYNRPVVLLIDEPCLSSNESFICMMKLADHVTTMGYRTGGSSGNPRFNTLPCGVTYSVPQWIDYLADKSPLEMNGIEPDKLFTNPLSDFSGEADPVLEAAMAHLAKYPLPETPIQGEKCVPVDQPLVTSVYPEPDTVINPGQTELKIQFDRPMNPGFAILLFQEGGAVSRGKFTYNPDKNEFTLPVTFFPGANLVASVKGGQSGDGFQDCDGHPAASYRWAFSVQDIHEDSRVKPAAKVISIEPSGDEKLGKITVFKITFDQPLDPASVIVPVNNRMGQSEYTVISSSTSQPLKNSIEVPVIMPESWSGDIELTGFRDRKGNLLPEIKIPVSTGSELFTDNAMQQFLMTSNPEMLTQLDKTLVKLREKQTSFKEITTGFSSLHPQVNGYKFFIQSTSVIAVENDKWFGDLGSYKTGWNGSTHWAYLPMIRTGPLVYSVKSEESDETSKTISDPLQLLPETPDHGHDRPHLEYLGRDTSTTEPVHRFRRWMILRYPSIIQVTLLEFGISEITGLMSYMKRQTNTGGITDQQITYQQINKDIEDSIFMLETYTDLKPEEKFTFDSPSMKDMTIECNSYLICDGSVGPVEMRFGVRNDQGINIGSGSSWR